MVLSNAKFTLFSFLLLLPSVAAAETDGAQGARHFLETFAANPSATRKLVTPDAMAAVGDMGGPYSDFLSEVRFRTEWLVTCRIASLQFGQPPGDQDSSEDIPPRFRGGKVEHFEGVYSCTGPDGIVDVPVVVILRDGRVVQFLMSMKRPEDSSRSP